MTKPIVGIALALLIGAACRWFELPVPAPNRLLGAFLVLAITAGYLVTDRIMTGTGRPAVEARQASEHPAGSDP